MVGKKLYISGKVQGVSFRFYAHEQASSLGISGWVRNLTDGRVEMILAGDPLAVETMIKWAHKGPPTAEVVSVEVVDFKEPLPLEPFFIKRDGGK